MDTCYESCSENSRDIDKAKTIIVSYTDDEGYLITKAMLVVREREDIHVIYLSTNTSSNKVKYFRKHLKASLYFYDTRFFRGSKFTAIKGRYYSHFKSEDFDIE